MLEVCGFIEKYFGVYVYEFFDGLRSIENILNENVFWGGHNGAERNILYCYQLLVFNITKPHDKP